MKTRVNQGTGEEGLALVEFAIVLPFIVLLILASIDLGRAMNQYHIMSQAAHNGGRIAMRERSLASVSADTELEVTQSLASYRTEISSTTISIDTTPGSPALISVSANLNSFFPLFKDLPIRTRLRPASG